MSPRDIWECSEPTERCWLRGHVFVWSPPWFGSHWHEHISRVEQEINARQRATLAATFLVTHDMMVGERSERLGATWDSCNQ